VVDDSGMLAYAYVRLFICVQTGVVVGERRALLPARCLHAHTFRGYPPTRDDVADALETYAAAVCLALPPLYRSMPIGLSPHNCVRGPGRARYAGIWAVSVACVSDMVLTTLAVYSTNWLFTGILAFASSLVGPLRLA